MTFIYQLDFCAGRSYIVYQLEGQVFISFLSFPFSFALDMSSSTIVLYQVKASSGMPITY